MRPSRRRTRPKTNPAIKSPSNVKVAPAAEQTEERPRRHISAKVAEPAEPAVEQGCQATQRASPRRPPVSAYKAPEASAKSSAKPSLTDKNRPVGIEKPAALDDLKLISGVGPKIEGILHSLGIYTFAQVASWKKAEREWVDGYLNFKGRIERDDWVKQAKALAKGGVAEYIRVFGKKPV
jgi:NADH-quinone oxidoreductase subunit E